MENLIKLRKESPVLGTLLGVEGMHALDGKVENVDLLYSKGVRMMATAHFFDNEVSGSAHGVVRAGLTDLGRQMVKRMIELKILIDVAHASEATIDDLVEMSAGKVPLLSSHTGLRSVCDNVRNLKDEHVKAIAKSGGLVGVAFFSPSLCGESLLKSAVETMRYIKKIAGVDCIALGSDWDGAVSVSITPDRLVHLTNALKASGDFTDSEIEKIMGGNVRRVLLANLPQN